MVKLPRFSWTFSAEICGVWNSSIRVCFLRFGSGGRRRRRRPRWGSLRVELDDELLLHRRVDLRPLGGAQHLRRESVVVGLEGADRGLAAGARALHEHLDLLEPLLHALAGGGVGGHLGGERRGLARAL